MAQTAELMLAHDPMRNLLNPSSIYWIGNPRCKTILT